MLKSSFHINRLSSLLENNDGSSTWLASFLNGGSTSSMEDSFVGCDEVISAFPNLIQVASTYRKYSQCRQSEIRKVKRLKTDLRHSISLSKRKVVSIGPCQVLQAS